MTSFGAVLASSSVRRESAQGLSPVERTRRRIYWPLLLPALLFYVVLFLAPTAYSIYISFTKWRGAGDTPVWVGVRNYVTLWRDDVFRMSFFNTLSIVFIAGAGIFILTMLVASILRELRHGQMIQTILFFPYMLSPIAVGIALSLVFVPNGLLNATLRGVGLGVLAQPWLTPDLAFKAILASLIWVSTGFYILLILSAIGRIPPQYYEQAELDGASRFQVFRHVTLPMTWDVTAVAVVLWMINAVRIFEFVYGFVGGGSATPPPEVRTIAVEQFLATTGGRAAQYELGLGSAMGVVMLVLIVVFVVGVQRLMRRESLEF